jgi:hypothetical protein
LLSAAPSIPNYNMFCLSYIHKFCYALRYIYIYTISKYIVKANVSRVENRKTFYNLERRNGESGIQKLAFPDVCVCGHVGIVVYCGLCGSAWVHCARNNICYPCFNLVMSTLGLWAIGICGAKPQTRVLSHAMHESDVIM